MTFRSSVDRFKEVRVSQRELIWLGIGVVAGLVLGLLIGWVWWPVDWESSGAVATPVEIATPAAVMTEPAAVAEPAGGDGGSIWGALFQLLVGAAVVGIGAYVVWLFIRNRRSSAQSSLPPAAVVSTTSVPSAAPAPPAEVISPYSTTPAPPRPAPPAPYSAAQAAATRVSPVQPPAMSNVPPFEREEDAAQPPIASTRSQPISPSVAVTAATAGALGANAAGSAPASLEQAAPTPAAAGQRAPATSANWQAGPARVNQYKTIDRFEATFTAGMEEFNVSKSIPGAHEDIYLGEYGIGISERHGMLNNDPDQVVAIEVYVFDKSDDKHLVNVSRVLLSEYADTHLRKHFEREKDRLGPIVAQPKTTLQLEARQFVLLCTITDVRYSHDGIFDRLAIEMELKDKKSVEGA